MIRRSCFALSIALAFVLVNNTLFSNTLNQTGHLKLPGQYEVKFWSSSTDNGKEVYTLKNAKGDWMAPKEVKTFLHLKKGTIDPQVMDSRPQWKNSSEKKTFIVQYRTQSLSSYKAEINQLGGEGYHYIPDNAHLWRLNQAAYKAVSKLNYVRAIAPLNSYMKMADDVYSVMADQRPLKKFWYNIVPVDLNEKDILMNEVRALGGKIINANDKSLLFVAEMTNQSVLDFTQSQRLMWIEKWQPIEEDMDNALAQGGVMEMQRRRLPEFTGVGMKGHVLEGINVDHPDFAAKETREKPIAVEAGTASSHGQATFGQVYGDGASDPTARGVLPDAQGYYTNYNAVINEEAGPQNPKSRWSLTKKLVEEHKVLFQTASWGYGRTTEYNARSAEMDQLIFDWDFPVTQSQSNSGTRMSRPQAWAKNIISVGAIVHGDNADPSDDFWRGASIGPATDGRIKPDLCAYYDKIKTTSLSGHTTTFGGTSGATPIVNGFLGMTIEMWVRGIFGNELTKPQSDYFINRPHFTTAKALLINSAKQYDFDGAAHNLTRVHQGWGFPDAWGLYANRGRMIVDNENTVLSNLESKEYTFEVKAETPDLKATLTWAEPAAALNASKQLINNLDLMVVDPDGVVYYGNNGLLEGNFSVAGGKANDVDNVENVILKDPKVGIWTVRVIASEINQDNHIETTAEDADFALVVRY